MAARFFQFLRASDLDDDFRYAQKLVGEFRETDVGGKKQLDIHPSLGKQPAADHLIEEITGVLPILAKELDRKGAWRAFEFRVGHNRQDIGKPGFGKGGFRRFQKIGWNQLPDQILSALPIIDRIFLERSASKFKLVQTCG
jgi:hypothetical protein